MTKAQVNDTIRTLAKRRGFETTDRPGVWGFSDIRSEELNFTYCIWETENTNWAERRVEYTLSINASVRKMGGEPTVEELLATAEEIRIGAGLVAELNNRKLTWTETF